MINWLILVFVSLFPSEIYQTIIDEPYFAHLNSEMFVYVSSALAMMYVGWLVAEPSSAPITPHISVPTRPQQPPQTVLTVLRYLTLVMPFVYLLRICLTPEVQEALAVDMPMNEIRDLVRDMSVNYLIQVAIVTNILCFYLTKPEQKLSSLLNWLGCLITISCLLLTMQRSLLMPYLLTIAVAYYQGHKLMSPLRALAIGALALLLGLCLFSVIALLRQQEGLGLFQGIVGYTIASYNRLALMLQGQLTLPDSGTGFYTLQWLFYPPVIRELLPIHELTSTVLGLPLPELRLDNYYAQFDAIADTPLADVFIWTTFFGAVYSDYGWLSLVIYLFYGAASQMAYVYMKKGNFLAILLYCYSYATALLWIGDGFIFQSTTLLMCYIAVLLHLAAYWRHKHTPTLTTVSSSR